MLKPLLFDLDGTLIDSVPDLAAAVDTVLTASGFASAGIAKVRVWIGNGASVLIERALADALGRQPSTTELDAALAHFMRLYRRACCVQSQLYPQVLDTLARLSEQGRSMAIVTNKPYEFALQISQHYGLEQYCPVLLGGDSVATKKPAPDMLQAAAAQMQHKLSDCVMIGDSRSDVLAAQAAGIDCYAVAYGYHRNEDLQALGALCVVQGFDELLGML